MVSIELLVIVGLICFILVFWLIPIAYNLIPCWMKGRLKKKNIYYEIETQSRFKFIPKIGVKSNRAYLFDLEEKIQMSEEKIKLGKLITATTAIISTIVIWYFAFDLSMAGIMVSAWLFVADEFLLDEWKKNKDYRCEFGRYGNIKGYRLKQMRLFHPYSNNKKECLK